MRKFVFTAFLVSTLLWLSSYTHHTAIGIDHDFKHKDQILHVFYRINWTGHGSIWVGYGSVWKLPETVKKLEKFDPASVFFQRIHKPLNSPSFWNKLGFWYIHSTTPKPVLWIGIPSWLPVLALLFLIMRFDKNKKTKLT